MKPRSVGDYKNTRGSENPLMHIKLKKSEMDSEVKIEKKEEEKTTSPISSLRASLNLKP